MVYAIMVSEDLARTAAKYRRWRKALAKQTRVPHLR
jgi:hypothetical protein